MRDGRSWFGSSGFCFCCHGGYFSLEVGVAGTRFCCLRIVKSEEFARLELNAESVLDFTDPFDFGAGRRRSCCS